MQERALPRQEAFPIIRTVVSFHQTFYCDIIHIFNEETFKFLHCFFFFFYHTHTYQSKTMLVWRTKLVGRLINEPANDKTYNKTYATSDDSDQTACARNLIISYRPYQRRGLLAVAIRQVSHLQIFPALFRECSSCSADMLVNKWPKSINQ